MSKTEKISLDDVIPELKLAFDNFCADAQAIIDEAKEHKNGRN